MTYVIIEIFLSNTMQLELPLPFLAKRQVFGDPHMVGLLGQKIDWAGVDNC